jgi:hypothetical protein
MSRVAKYLLDGAALISAYMVPWFHYFIADHIFVKILHYSGGGTAQILLFLVPPPIGILCAFLLLKSASRGALRNCLMSFLLGSISYFSLLLFGWFFLRGLSA